MGAWEIVRSHALELGRYGYDNNTNGYDNNTDGYDNNTNGYVNGRTPHRLWRDISNKHQKSPILMYE